MEKLMQFVWKHRLGLHQDLTTVDGRRLRVIDQGTLNEDAGPDFFNASVEIGSETWVGNIEIHVRASDWYRHGHDKDEAYRNVILHVVQFDDAPVYRSDGSVIPQVVLRCSAQAAARCNALLDYADRMLPCENIVRGLPDIYRIDWLTALAMERLYRKSERIIEMVKATNGDWECAAYVTLARGLGFGLNGDPFEMLARNLPLKFMYRHRDEIITIEAFIFGQAGLIPAQDVNEDCYVARLRQEYEFVANKFSLNRLHLQWKMARTRPQNFPYRRLALLAQMVHEGFNLMGRLIDASDTDSIRRVFDVRLMGFWATHFTFSGRGGGCSPRALSAQSIDRLMINVAIPLLHARAMWQDDLDGMARAVELLQSLPPEDNRDVRLFSGVGITCEDAFVSQALVELRREYCEKKKCIYCRFGHRMLSAEIQK